MNYIFIFLFGIFFPTLIYADDKPEILDYIPRCEYQVLDDFTVKKSFTKTTDKHKIQQQLLSKIKSKAEEISADAILLVDRKLSSKVTSAKVKLFTLAFKSELIKLCNENESLPLKPTSIDGAGNQYIAQQSIRFSQSKKFEFNFDRKTNVLAEKAIQPQVSLTSIYGVKLNASFEQIKNTLGEPNLILKLSPELLVLGYGRKLWLYLQQDKLVKASSQNLIFNQNIINKIPLRKGFDDNSWVLDGQIRYKTPKSAITKVYQDKKLKQLSSLEQFIESKENELHFQYHRYKDKQLLNSSYLLNDFSLQKKNFTLFTLKNMSDDALFKKVSKILLDLDETSELTIDDIKIKLGLPNLIIHNAKNQIIYGYGNQLMIMFDANDVSYFHFMENIYKLQKTPTKWHVAGFFKGQMRNDISKVNDVDFESDNYVELSIKEHRAILYFDGKNQLTEAKFTVY